MKPLPNRRVQRINDAKYQRQTDRAETDRDLNFEIYVMNANGSGPVNRTTAGQL